MPSYSINQYVLGYISNLLKVHWMIFYINIIISLLCFDDLGYINTPAITASENNDGTPKL